MPLTGIIKLSLNILVGRKENITTIDKIHLKCDCMDESKINGKREPILFSFVSGELPGYIMFGKAETKQFTKTNKPVLNKITFYSGHVGKNKQKGDENY